jgi:hypothetical protein
MHEMQAPAFAGTTIIGSVGCRSRECEGLGSSGVISFDDSNVPTRLITLGVALVAFGLGCHFWTDRVSRIAGLIIGAIQLCR